MHKPLIIAAALFALSATPVAAQSHNNHHLVTPADNLVWKAGPGSLPPGAQFVVLVGDPGKDGPYILRLKFPAGYKIPAHIHPNDENLTVISGTFHMGMGGKFDETKGQALKAGGLAHMPKGTEHFGWVSEDTVVQLHGVGPAGVTYVNPADDPRKK